MSESTAWWWLLILLMIVGCQRSKQDTERQTSSHDDGIDLAKLMSSPQYEKDDCVEVINRLVNFWTVKPSITISLLRLFTYKDQKRLLQILRNGLYLPLPVSPTIVYLLLTDDVNKNREYIGSAMSTEKFPMLNPYFYRNKSGLCIPNGSYAPQLLAYGIIPKVTADTKGWEEFLSTIRKMPLRSKFVVSRKAMLEALRRGSAVERVEAARVIGRLGLLTEEEMGKELRRLWASGSPDDKAIALLLGFEGKHGWWEQNVITALSITDVTSAHLYPFHSTAIRDVAVFTLQTSSNRNLCQKAVKTLIQTIRTSDRTGERSFFVSAFPALASTADVKRLLSLMKDSSAEIQVTCIKALASTKLLSRLPVEFLLEELFPRVSKWLKSSNKKIKEAVHLFLCSFLTEGTEKGWKAFLKELYGKKFLSIVSEPALEVTKAVLRYGKPDLRVEVQYKKGVQPLITVSLQNYGKSTVYIPRTPSASISVAHLWSASGSDNRFEREHFLYKREYTPFIPYEKNEVVSIAPGERYVVEYPFPQELRIEVESSSPSVKREILFRLWNRTPYFVDRAGQIVVDKPLWCDSIQVLLRR